MSVARCQEEISSAEFGEWIAYFSIEPFGDRVEDIRAGTIASAIANSNRAKGTEAYKPLDFFGWINPEPQTAGPPPPEAIAAGVFGINLAEMKANGTKQFVLRRPKRAGTD